MGLSAFQIKVFSAIQPLIEPGVAAADSVVFWANRKFTPPQVKDGTTTYQTLQVISGPTMLGLDRWKETGTFPAEKATIEGDRVFTLSINFYGDTAPDDAQSLEDKMVSPNTTELFESLNLAFERSNGIIDAPIDEDNVWIQCQVLDLILRTTKSSEEDIKTIRTVEFTNSLP